MRDVVAQHKHEFSSLLMVAVFWGPILLGAAIGGWPGALLGTVVGILLLVAVLFLVDRCEAADEAP